ncbi:MAG: methylmalonyl Co-A mutase-associated GTPase MeaB [Elusimicrobia bacterium]|nr:methylmalonyl Co-A mutase-associated GTPase MeaB [Elusimicrobiota bacterium]
MDRDKTGLPPARNAASASLAERVARGDQVAVGRALSILIDESEGSDQLGRDFFAAGRRGHKLGVCGPPGSGKSSLINRLVAHYRRAGEKVGILAVDPTSPWTGGAFLGDRLRVQSHAMDPGVFFRSLGSRGTVGGLTSTIFGAIHVLEAWGADRIVLETVGTGQDEVEISHVADTVLYVTTPSLGDEIQAMKAGAMEAADILVLNKSDLAERDKALAALQEALGLGGREKPGWQVEVAAASAAKGEGIAELASAVERHRAWLGESGEGARRAKDQLRMELSWLVSRRVARDTVAAISDAHLEDLLARRTDPATLGARLAARHGAARSVDHVGIAVRSLSTALPFYRDALGLEVVCEEEVAAQRVRVAFLAPRGATPAECQIELLEPADPESAVGRFLSGRGPGLHHVAFRTPDIEADMRRLSEGGWPPLEAAPRSGARGHRVCFLHPKHGHGVLTELIG